MADSVGISYILTTSPYILTVEKVRKIPMAKKRGDDFEYLANNPDFVPDPEIEEFMESEISRAPKDPELLAHRLRNNTAASPHDAVAIWMQPGKT